MKRLLKIKEFSCLMKAKELEHGGEEERSVKRPRKTTTGIGSFEDAVDMAVNSMSYDRFLEIFEIEVAKDILWWLPGHRGEAFAVNWDKFETELVKAQGNRFTVAGFRECLDRWGFQQMRVPSLFGKILTFKKHSQTTVGNQEQDGEAADQSGLPHFRHLYAPSHPQRRVQGDQQLYFTRPAEGMTMSADATIGASDASQSLAQIAMSFGELQRYLAQPDITQVYFYLLWQELLRQLSVLFLPQSQVAPSEAGSSTQAGSSPSEIAEVALLLQQHRTQQQLIGAQIYQSSAQADPHVVMQQLDEIHKQQLSYLTYQIVTLVAASMEEMNQDPHSLEIPPLQRVLVKHMMALVLLQLQQEQRNLEFVHQEKLSALAFTQTLQGALDSIAFQTENPTSVEVAATNGIRFPAPITVSSIPPSTAANGDLTTTTTPRGENALMDLSPMLLASMLTETGIQSLSRVHQLLAEAAIIMSHTLVTENDRSHLHETAGHSLSSGPFSESGLLQGPFTPQTSAGQSPR